jgi:hypothetical protein
MARGKKKDSTAGSDLAVLTNQVAEAKKELEAASKSVADLETAMTELRNLVEAGEPGSIERDDHELKLEIIEDEDLPAARDLEEEVRKRLAYFEGALANAEQALKDATPADPAAPAAATGAKPPVSSPAPLRAGGRVRVRWLLNGRGVLDSPATIKTVRDAEKGILDVTIEHRGLLINLDGVTRATSADQVPSWS